MSRGAHVILLQETPPRLASAQACLGTEYSAHLWATSGRSNGPLLVFKNFSVTICVSTQTAKLCVPTLQVIRGALSEAQTQRDFSLRTPLFLYSKGRRKERENTKKG